VGRHRARPAERPGQYVARLQIPLLLNVGERTVGVWIGTRYDTFVQETALRRFRLEGDVKGRPRRIMSLELPWDVGRVEGDEQPRPTVIEASSARGRRR
jgi:hypothetical protein